MMAEGFNLPMGWQITSLEKIATWGSGGTPSRNVEKYFQGTIPWVKTGELESKYIRETEEHISDEALKNSSAKLFPKGSVGIAMYGATIGKLSIWGIDASTNQACAVGIPSKAIINEFLYYFLLSERQNLIKAGKGGAQPNLSQGIIKEWPIDLPPINEQHRIVAKIEELFSELDKGIESLKTAQAQLKVYRQALLKHAFEGKLTAQWRTEYQDELETAEALLKRIQQERAQRHQQQLAEWEASGKQGSKPKAPKALPSLTSEDLAELPDGWIVLSVESLFDIEDGDRGEHYPTKGDFSETGHCLFLNAKNVTKRGFTFQEMSFISEKKDLELRKGKLKRGDIVFTSRGTLGNIAHYNDSIKYEHVRINSGMFIIRNYDIALTPDFLYFQLNAPVITSQIEKLQSGTAQPQLPIREFKSFRFVIPSKSEQQLIVYELESRLSEVDQLDQTITTSLQQAEALRQSILKKAFSGQLVPQDPNDEPASVLLARIKAQKMDNVSNETKLRRTRKVSA